MGNLKMWAQIAMAVVASIWAALTDNETANNITREEWVVVVSLLVGALAVQVVPNLDAGIAKYAKGVTSFLSAALPVLGVLMVGGLTQAEILEVIIVGAGAIGLVTVVGNPGYVFARKPVSQVGASGSTAGTGF
jgi:hypothetical protein